MPFVRSGECNRCGECCGAQTAPSPKSPWPKSWPDSIRNHSYAQITAEWPQAILFGVVPDGDGITKSADNGTTRIAGGGAPQDFYWVHVDGVGYCKDTSPGHDGSSYLPECPFLKDDPGDGSRPCGLVGTNNDNDFRVACEEGPTNAGIPSLQFETQAEVDRWFAKHPSCSFEYTET